MKWTFLFVCFFSSCALHSQTVHVKELRFRPSSKYYNIKESTIVYPIIVTGNPTVSQLINRSIEATVLRFDPEDNLKAIRAELRSMIRMGLTDMGYEVTYNKRG